MALEACVMRTEQLGRDGLARLSRLEGELAAADAMAAELGLCDPADGYGEADDPSTDVEPPWVLELRRLEEEEKHGTLTEANEARLQKLRGWNNRREEERRLKAILAQLQEFDEVCKHVRQGSECPNTLRSKSLPVRFDIWCLTVASV